MKNLLPSACAALLGGLGTWACAQDTLPAAARNFPPVTVVNTALEYRQFEKVEITGSLITAVQAKDILPVLVVSRQDIERSGATDLPQLLQALPHMFNFQELGTMTGTRDGGPETAAIHGNAEGTLVLLNGQRLPAYGSQSIFLDRTMVDINIVPLSAIERVEVLADGASSRYGSDAVAGVVNIITRASTSGLGIATEYTRPANGRGTGQMVNLSWGTGRLNSQAPKLQVHFSAEQQQALLAGDVPNARNSAIPFTIAGDTFWAVNDNSRSPYGWPANVYNTITQTTRHPSLDRSGKCPANWYMTSGAPDSIGCWPNTQKQLTLYPAVHKTSLFIDSEMAINSFWRGFAQVVVGQQEQRSVPSEGIETSLDLGDGREALINTAPLGVLRQSYRNRQHHLVAGLRGEADGWDVRVSASTGQHRVTRVYTDGLPISMAAFRQVPVTLDELTQADGQFSPELLAKYAPVKRMGDRVLDDGETQLQSLSLAASRDWLETDHGPIATGLGWDWRQEKVDYLAPNPSRPSFSGERQNWSVYSEVQAPLSDEHDVSMALRHDQYSDFGGVQTGKLGWRWRPQKGLMLRSSVGTGFRAPTLSQMQTISTEIYELTDLQTQQNLVVRNAGNPHLKPEQSLQAGLGFRWEPNPRWTVGADFWQLHIRNTFGVYSAQDVLDSQTLRDQYITTENGIAYLNLPNLNLGQSRRQGVDYDHQWREPTDWGRFRLTWRGTWNLQAQKQSVNQGPFESELGVYASNTERSTPRHQWALSASLEQSDWSLLAALHYRSGFVNPMSLSQNYIGGPRTELTTRIPGYWTVDVGVQWRPDRHWTLTANVRNITNRSPVLMHVASSYFEGVDTRFASYYGRTLKLKAEYKF